MKRNFLFLVGFFAVALVSVIFIACEKDKNDNGALVGTWKYIDDYASYYTEDECYVLITFNKDNTGTINERTYYGRVVNTTFAYTYDSDKEILKLDLDDVSYYSTFGYGDYYNGYSKFKVEWIGDNRFYMNEIFEEYDDYDYYYDDYYKMGPFIRQ